MTDITIGDLFVAGKLAASRGEARRLGQQGALSANDTIVIDTDQSARTLSEGGDEPIVLRAGKRHQRVWLPPRDELGV